MSFARKFALHKPSRPKMKIGIIDNIVNELLCCLSDVVNAIFADGGFVPECVGRVFI